MIVDWKAELLSKIEKKDAQIGVIGLGYVGLPLVLRFIEVGFPVIGFDIDQNKILSLQSGNSYIKHIPSSQIYQAVKSGRFQASSDFSRTCQPDALILCLPTPLNKHREPDLRFVINTMNTIKPYLRAGQVISLESTTYPGTTEEALLPVLEKRGFTVGRDIFLVYSPEREDPGNPSYSTQNIPKVCGGITNDCLEVGSALYESVVDRVIKVSSTRTAEMIKLLENIFRAVNIALANEMKLIAERMGIDIWEVIDAASTKPFGFMPFYPGPGLGGHCIPIDPFYLTWKAREAGLHTRFIELAGEVNTSMPYYVVNKVMEALNERGKALKGSKVLILGIAYKKNVDDMRESPAVVIMKLLKEKGAVISYSDPYIPIFPKKRDHYFDLTSVELTEDTLKEFDCVLITTDHDCVDYRFVEAHSRLVVDTRRAIKFNSPKVVRA